MEEYEVDVLLRLDCFSYAKVLVTLGEVVDDDALKCKELSSAGVLEVIKSDTTFGVTFFILGGASLGTKGFWMGVVDTVVGSESPPINVVEDNSRTFRILEIGFACIGAFETSEM